MQHLLFHATTSLQKEGRIYNIYNKAVTQQVFIKVEALCLQILFFKAQLNFHEVLFGSLLLHSPLALPEASIIP